MFQFDDRKTSAREEKTQQKNVSESQCTARTFEQRTQRLNVALTAWLHSQ